MMNFEILKHLGDLKNPPKKETSKFSHSIHPYPAKYIPQIPNQIISEFTNERHTVLDPFCGCGTTLLESKLLGRDSIGIDLNPIGAMISRVKTQEFSQNDFLFFNDFKLRIQKSFIKKTSKLWIPDIPNISHWFSKEAIDGLSRLIAEIRKVESLKHRRVLNLAISNIIVGVSNQESETRFAAKNKHITTNDVLETFIKRLDKIILKLKETTSNSKFNSAKSRIILGNTLNLDKYIDPRSVDLIVTSPPYLNSFDYYLYHKFRIFWLSYPENFEEVFPIEKIKKDEIGSRYRYSGTNADDVSSFRVEMKNCFQIFNSVLKPSKMLFLVVGDSIVKGNFMKMDEYYETLATECGFKLLSKISYPMSGASRSFISTNTVNKHYPKKESHILAFQSLNINKSKGKIIITPNENSINKPLNTLEVNELPQIIESGSNFYIKNNEVTAYTHGLVKYPAKYIPQIPSWAIKNFTKEGDCVLDTFNGSGTSGLESYIHKRNYFGIDINPLAVLSTKVKTTFVSKKVLENSTDELKNILKNLKKSEIQKVEFELQDFWFDKEVLTKLFKLKTAIDKIRNTDAKDLMRVSMSSIIKRVSYLDESQLKVKRDPNKVLNGVPDPFELFFRRLQKDSQKILELAKFHQNDVSVKLEVGSAYNFINMFGGLKNKVDLIVTSPPYINAMNYPMYHRYELLLLGLVTPNNYISHQADYIGTERVYAKEYKSFSPIFNDEKPFISLNKKLHAIFLKEPKRYYITQKYFTEMNAFFDEAAKALKKKKKLILVCGTNTIKGESINTSFELSNIAMRAGFKELFHFSYEIRKHRFKITRHETAGKINNDIVLVLQKI